MDVGLGTGKPFFFGNFRAGIEICVKSDPHPTSPKMGEEEGAEERTFTRDDGS
jgi:hypothetical protein